MSRKPRAILLCGLGFCVPAAVWAGGSATPLTAVRVAEGLERPVWAGSPPGDFERLFVIEKRGRVRVIRGGAVLAAPLLDIDALVGGGTSDSSEQGLLAMAFHPHFANNGLFYVSYTAVDGTSTVRRYRMSAVPDVADPASGLVVLAIAHPQLNHNGGWMAFSPQDGYLYIATGDGGGAFDTGAGHTADTGNAQDITANLLGKILRIDVDGDDFPGDANRNYAIPPDNPFTGGPGDDEIWAYGLRNPWRNSFDPASGDLYIADVGQGSREEVDFQPAGLGGRNYGWRCMEGDTCTGLTGCTCNDPGLVDPIGVYSHAVGCSITGGEVYRGCAVPDLQGTYFFADYCSARIWSVRYDGRAVSDFQERTTELAPAGGLAINDITSFGRDGLGELYICDQGGEVFKIVPDTAGPQVDCNGNLVEDSCDVAAGASPDSDADGVLDECEGVIYVDDDAAGAGTGTSWVDAMTDLQPALDLAAARAGAGACGIQIWVAAGLYAPAVPAAPADPRTAVFQLIDCAGIYGGFAGGETLWSQRDPRAHLTYLTGDLAGNDGPGFAGRAENSYHVVNAGGTAATAVLDGVVVRGGNADAAFPHSVGGGVLSLGGAATIANCLLLDNSAQGGGGMFNSGDMVLSKCVFLGNAAIAGGGVFNGARAPALQSCVFLGNAAVLTGGGLLNTGGSPVVERCWFVANYAASGCPLLDLSGTAIIEDAVIFGNYCE